MLEILPSKESDFAEPDRVSNAPHPRQNLSLVGHIEAERAFLDAYRSGRLPHAWLIGGMEGIGKATLAYRMARFVLTNPDPTTTAVRNATDLSVYSKASAALQIAASAHPDLAVIRRGPTQDRKSIASEIRVDDVRRGLDVFTKTAAAGGWRVAIVDACDDLNTSSANALLKTLEEPPARGLLLLVAHQTGRLLPTIRSRCRMQLLRPLAEPGIVSVTRGLPETFEIATDIHLRAAALSEGSVRRALSFLDPKRLAFNDRVEAVLQALPSLEAGEIDSVAEATAGKAGEEAFARFCEICESWLSKRLASGPLDSASLARLPELWNKLNDARRDVEIYNLDRRPFVIAMVSELASAARRQA